jgi:para-aminobenzoate synthetase component I
MDFSIKSSMPAVRSSETFTIASTSDFKQKIFEWAKIFEVVCYLDHNHYQGYPASDVECLVAVGTASQLLETEENGAFDSLKVFFDEKKDWLFGFLTYDLKNDVEQLTSNNFDGVGFPVLHFFQPQVVLAIHTAKVTIHSLAGSPDFILKKIERTPIPNSQFRIPRPLPLRSRISRPDYLDTIQTIRQHILRGDIYEMNFCQEFFVENCQLDAPSVFQRLNGIAKAPFSAFYKLRDRYLLCASPERFLKKTGTKLISQPIKGTIRRGASRSEDEMLQKKLFNSPKDRSENVMIVDLVRNDLARSCRAGTVRVEELFGVYRFEQVMQLISTVTGELEEDVHFIDAIRRAFPMGSMTGAPKVRSMELIEKYEQTRRGLYSGAVGYFTPRGDFDFNVVIRSMLYNEADRYLSFQVGGAIIFDSVPEDEFAECMLKAKGILTVLESI